MSQLVLSLFPGIGLLDLAFEEAGFSVVRGPDLLWGGDVRNFDPPAGRFDGVIGGPPCQKFSTAGNILGGSGKDDLIPEFIRVVEAVRPAWVVMENVVQAIGHPAIPRDWFHFKLRDFDCGGETSRVRAFWTWPFMALVSPRAAGEASHSVMASTFKRGGGQYAKDKGFLPGNLPIAEYARLQGVPQIGERLVEFKSSRAFAIHVLGNGVPLSMGRAVARSVRQCLQQEAVA